MNIDHLVHMANRIGEFFQAMPDRAEAMDGIATHLKRFWEPRMREEFFAHLAKGGAGLDPVVIAAAAGIHPPHQAAA